MHKESSDFIGDVRLLRSGSTMLISCMDGELLLQAIGPDISLFVRHTGVATPITTIAVDNYEVHITPKRSMAGITVTALGLWDAIMACDAAKALVHVKEITIRPAFPQKTIMNFDIGDTKEE